MPLDLVDQPRRRYRDNPLTQVICQVRFPVLQRFDEPGFLGPVQDALRDRYPRAVQEQQIGLMVGPGGVMPAQDAGKLWRFQDAEQAWSIVLGRDFFGVETARYEQFEVLRDRLRDVLPVILSLGVNWRERMGLRYVNQIRHPDGRTPSKWRELLNPMFLGMVGGDELGADVIHAIQEIRLREQDGVLLIRHGLIGPEASNDSPFYLLDLDYADESPQPLHPDQLIEQVSSYHETIHNVFEMTLTPSMREHLGEDGVIE
jgi:uncharacterized protein (TIGR04255 family)